MSQLEQAARAFVEENRIKTTRVHRLSTGERVTSSFYDDRHQAEIQNLVEDLSDPTTIRELEEGKIEEIRRYNAFHLSPVSKSTLETLKYATEPVIDIEQPTNTNDGEGTHFDEDYLRWGLQGLTTKQRLLISDESFAGNYNLEEIMTWVRDLQRFNREEGHERASSEIQDSPRFTEETQDLTPEERKIWAERVLANNSAWDELHKRFREAKERQAGQPELAVEVEEKKTLSQEEIDAILGYVIAQEDIDRLCEGQTPHVANSIRYVAAQGNTSLADLELAAQALREMEGEVETAEPAQPEPKLEPELEPEHVEEQKGFDLTEEQLDRLCQGLPPEARRDVSYVATSGKLTLDQIERECDNWRERIQKDVDFLLKDPNYQEMTKNMTPEERRQNTEARARGEITYDELEGLCKAADERAAEKAAKEAQEEEEYEQVAQSVYSLITTSKRYSFTRGLSEANLRQLAERSARENITYDEMQAIAQEMLWTQKIEAKTQKSGQRKRFWLF